MKAPSPGNKIVNGWMRRWVNGETPVHMHGLLESFSSHGEREEEAQTALLVEGATLAPVIER